MTDAGKLIANARIAAGLTQAKLARRAGTSQAMVARYETGASSPTVAARQRCLRAAGCELLLASQLLSNPELGYGDLSRSPSAGCFRCSGWPAGWRTSPGSGSMCWQRKHSPGRPWRGPSPRRCRYDVG
jgi:transcriptional regulator with XRE-family HTH domain